MKLIVLILLIISSQSTLGQSTFLQRCEDALESNDQLIFKQISWLKTIYKTQNCIEIYNKIKATKSFSEIIPNLTLKRAHIQRGFIPFEFKETQIPYDIFASEWDKAENFFLDLNLFKEFKNLKHFVYESNYYRSRTLCQILEQIPSIEGISIPGWDLDEQDIRCIENKNLNIYILGNFTPNKNFESIKNKIVGINNFLGDLSELHHYKQLRYLGLLNYNGNSSLKFLWGMRNLTHLNLNVINVEHIEDISHLTTLHYITLNCIEKDYFEVPTKLSDVKCKKNYIRNIGFLGRFKWLKGLDISWNEIEDITTVSKLKNLEYLSLRNNQIMDLPDLKDLKKLRFLDLAGNMVASLEKLANSPNIEYLNVSSNRIYSLSHISNLKNLSYLSAGNNPIVSLKDFSPTTNLKVLALDSTSSYKFNLESFSPISFILNKKEAEDKKHWAELLIYEDLTKYHRDTESKHKIKGLESFEFQKLKNLEVLSLSGNGISKLHNISEINKLRYLDLSGNNLKAFNLKTSLPKSLEYINLRNSIEGHLSDLSIFDKMLMFDLGDNKVEVNGTIFPKSLEFIKMDNCSLNELPNLESAKNLYWAELQKNNFATLSLKGLRKLYYLNLKQNALTNIPDFSSNSELKNIILDDNRIENLKNLDTFVNIYPHISMMNNFIDDLSPLIEQFYSNYGLKLDGNPINKNSDQKCPKMTPNNDINFFCNSK